MFREMRRNKQLLSKQDCVEVLERGITGVIAVLGDEDYPYAVPVNYVYTDSKIYFHCATSGHKLDAIKKHEKVSFCVVDQDTVIPEKYTTGYRSVIAFGNARIVGAEETMKKTITVLGEKYCPHQMDMDAVIERNLEKFYMVEIEIEHLTGKEGLELAKQRTNLV